MKFSRSLPLLVLLAIASAFYFFVSGEKTESSDRKMVVAVSADNPPFTFLNTEEGGQPQGFEIDLIQAIAEKMDVTLEIRDMDFPNIIASLQSGRADISIAAFEKTPERAENVDFSDPYYEAQRSLLSLSPFPPPPFSFEGQKIGVQLGSAHEIFLKNMQKKHSSLVILSYNRIGEMAQDLKNRRVNYILLDRAPAAKLAEQDFFYQFELPVIGDVYVMAFPKKSPFLKEVNETLKELRREGTLSQLSSKWFGS